MASFLLTVYLEVVIWELPLVFNVLNNCPIVSPSSCPTLTWAVAGGRGGEEEKAFALAFQKRPSSSPPPTGPPHSLELSPFSADRGLKQPKLFKLRVVGNSFVLIQARLLVAARPQENSLGSGGYLDVVVPFPVGCAETMRRETTTPRMPQCYGGRRDQLACRDPPPLG